MGALIMPKSRLHTLFLLLLVLSLFGCGGGSTSGGGGCGGNPPGTPTGLTATPGDAQGALSWSSSARATSYHVKRSTTSGGSYTQVAAPAAASYTDMGLINDTAYYYVVSGVNSDGESTNSGEVKGQPTSAPPPAPTG